MDTAIKLCSRLGHLTEEIRAINIRSYADSRQKGPFVDVHGKPVYWKGWSKRKTSRGKYKRPHFSKYPYGEVKKAQVDLEGVKKSNGGESKVHKKARIELAKYIESEMLSGQEITWAFKDPEISDFSFTGNLLEQVVEVKTNYRYTIKEFGLSFEYDIALLGPQVSSEPIILGGIELEKTHRFEQLKLLASRCLSFPLISINIEDLKEDDIDEEWCRKSIRETKNSSDDERRRNFVYLHSMLIPFYLDIPSSYRPDKKHCIIIFCRPERLRKLFRYLNEYKKLLEFNGQDIIHIDKPVLKELEPTSVSGFENEGSIAGVQWREYNEREYIRVTMSVIDKKKEKLLFFSHILARLVNTYADAIVGYKYSKGIKNPNHDEQFWTSETGINVCPKTISQPLFPILEFYNQFGILDRIKKLQGIKS